MTKNQIGNIFFIFITKLKQKMKVLKKHGENFIWKRNCYIPYGYNKSQSYSTFPFKFTHYNTKVDMIPTR
jgi:hypothetical protein